MPGQRVVVEHLEEVLGRRPPLPLLARSSPNLTEAPLQVAHHGLRYTRVGDAVHPTLMEGHLVVNGQLAPRRHDLVLLVREQVEYVLLEGWRPCN